MPADPEVLPDHWLSWLTRQLDTRMTATCRPVGSSGLTI